MELLDLKKRSPENCSQGVFLPYLLSKRSSLHTTSVI